VVKELGHALLTVGLPLHSVQHYMDMAAKRFGLHLHVATIGNSIWATFGCDSTCHLIQVTNPGMSLSKMVHMTRIAEDIVRAKVTPRQAVARIVVIPLPTQLYICVILMSLSLLHHLSKS
jgi:uncharacterized membrane protein YjjP (DUF1212 family)